MSSLGVNDVKSKQFLLITKAGLAVSQSKGKGIVNIEQQILAEFTEAVKAVFLPPIFLGFDRNGLCGRRTTSSMWLDSMRTICIPALLSGGRTRRFGDPHK